MICMYRDNVSSVQVLVPLFHARDNCETLLFIMSIILLGADEFSNSSSSSRQSSDHVND